MVPSTASTATSMTCSQAAADDLALVEGDAFFLGSLADHDVPLHGKERNARRIASAAAWSAAGLVSAAHEARGGERTRLRHPHDLESQVSIHQASLREVGVSSGG